MIRQAVDEQAVAAKAKEIAETFGILVEPDQSFEIRAPKTLLPGATETQVLSSIFRGDNLKAAARQAIRYSKHAPAVYFTLNPLKPSKKRGSASTSDIVRRRLMLVDFDPVRPADISATDEEKATALSLARAIRVYLVKRGWKCLILADSGNGYHLLVFVDLPTDDAGLVKSVLEALARLADTATCKVDCTVFDPPRITKVYGTEVRKGEASEERPHRFSKLLEWSGDRTPVTIDQLKDLVEELAPEPANDLEAEIERKRATMAAPNTNSHSKPKRNGPTSEKWTPEMRAIAYLKECPGSVSGQGGHNAAFWAACQIGPGFDLSPDTTFRLLRDYFSPRCEPEWSDKEIQHKVDEAYKKRSDRGFLLNAERKVSLNGNGKGGSPPPKQGEERRAPVDDRPQIEVNAETHLVKDASIKALARDPEIYRCKGNLVAVIEEDLDEVALTKKTGFANTKGSPKIVRLAEATIGSLLTKNAEFFSWRKDKSGEEYALPVRPPDYLIKTVAAEPTYPGIRPLVAVAECPFPREDGSIVDTPGYDPETRILYRPKIDFPKVAGRPTQADAMAAWEILQEPIKDFPFAEPGDKVAWLAGLLASIARRSIDGSTPGLAVNGNRAGTGKGLLIDLIGLLVLGRRVATSSYPSDKHEAEKAKLALGLSGRPLVHFDNLDEGQSYGGGAVDSMLTSDTVAGRVLGESRDEDDVPLRVMFFLSGNNITPFKDSYRRWLPCNLVTDLERPEERDDIEEQDLRKSILLRRGELVRAALTILRAHAVAGRPKGKWAPLGSFEQWDPIVRGAVWYATGLDCCATRRKAADESPDRQAKIAFLKGWLELPNGGTKGLTASEAVKLVAESPKSYPTAHEAFSNMTRDGKFPTGSKVGAKIRGQKNSITDGMKFVAAGEEHKTTLWKVETITQPSQSSQIHSNPGGDGGDGGDRFSPPAGSAGFDPDVTTSGGMRHASLGALDSSPLSPPSPPLAMADDREEFAL